MHKDNIRALGQRSERIQASSQWKDGKFRNPSGASVMIDSGDMLPVALEFLKGGKTRSPRVGLPSLDPRPQWQAPVDSGLRVTWLGHSTILIEIDGARILTDPVWVKRVSPIGFAGPKRFQPVPVDLDALPPIDAVIISHDHYDHLDRRTVEHLAAKGVPIVTTLGVGKHFQKWGIPLEQFTELDWWESTEIAGIKFTATPTQHFSGRGVLDRDSTLWASYVIEGPNHRFYFGADSGLTPQFAEIANRFGRFDVVALEIGAFHPSWAAIHMGPDNAWKAFEMLGGDLFLPIHWGTFDLAVHAWDTPPERVFEIANDRPLVMPRLGQVFEPSRWQGNEAWWREAKV